MAFAHLSPSHGAQQDLSTPSVTADAGGRGGRYSHPNVGLLLVQTGPRVPMDSYTPSHVNTRNTH